MSNYGPKVEWSKIEEGVRIYYTGDCANISGQGVITKKDHSVKWGYRNIFMLMDDGREINVELSNFQPGPGRRFWLLADWQSERQRMLAIAQEEYARVIARRTAVA